jgi:hypothetical protein
MNEDGTWFGSVSPYSSFVPEGWEGAVRRGKWLADHAVLVVGDKITAVGPSARVKAPEGAEVIDLAGQAVIPGLIDMHMHLGGVDGVLAIASGVTTGRDVGNEPDTLDDFKNRFDEGTAIGPHLLRFGFTEGRNEKAAASEVTAETVEEARAAVEFYAARKYEGVKIYNSVKTELVPVIAKEAHARGMLVTGHVPVHMLANEAVRAGYDGIEHINMLFLNFFATKETDTRDTTRFTLMGENAAGFDLAGKPARDFFALLRRKKTVVTPTVDAFEDLLVGESGKIIPGLEAVVDRLPVTDPAVLPARWPPGPAGEAVHLSRLLRQGARDDQGARGRAHPGHGRHRPHCRPHGPPRDESVRARRRLEREDPADDLDRRRPRHAHGQAARHHRARPARRPRHHRRRPARRHGLHPASHPDDARGRAVPIGPALRGSGRPPHPVQPG